MRAVSFTSRTSPRLRAFRWISLVVEETDGAVGVGPGIVLPGEADPRTQAEVALLAAESPRDVAGGGVDLVDGPRVAGGDEELVVRRRVDGIDVHRIEGGGLRIGRVRLGEIDVVGAVPVEDELPAGEVDPLNGGIERGSLRGAAYGPQVGAVGPVRREVGDAVAGDQEFVQVRRESVVRLDRHHLPVRLVDHDVVSMETDAVRRDLALPPGQDRLPLKFWTRRLVEACETAAPTAACRCRRRASVPSE